MGFYLYTTIDRITTMRWYRTYEDATKAWQKWYDNYGVEATIRGAA